MTTLRVLMPALVAFAIGGCATTPNNPASTAALAVLASENDVHAKARACQELAVVGGPEAVPALAALLSHPVLSDYARSGLEAIAAPSAGAALREALRTTEGRPLAGVVNSLGVRRDAAAIPALQALALDPKRGVAPEALASLGMIATDSAARALEQVLTTGPAALQLPAAHASLTAAFHLSQIGNSAAARRLLEVVIAKLPAGHARATAEAHLARLKS